MGTPRYSDGEFAETSLATGRLHLGVKDTPYPHSSAGVEKEQSTCAGSPCAGGDPLPTVMRCARLARAWT